MLLAGAKSSDSINQPMYINVDLKAKHKLFKKTKIDESIDLYTLYKNEKDSCMRYRMLFVINPVCTNILFNKKTEVVAFEGSDKCVTLSDYATLKEIVGDSNELYKLMSERCKNSAKETLYLCDAIRDTEYSHPDLGNLTYHCGADMCNNHILRSKDFTFSNYVSESKSSGDSIKGFNTISDIVRNETGVEETNFIGLTSSVSEEKAHLYTVDNLMTFNESFSRNLYEKDGWIGFDNASNINIDNVSYKDPKDTKKEITVSVNRVINNIGPCSFVDLYPGRDLLSAVPKYNCYRHRQEHNWDYCLTYPYKNDREKLYEINGHVGESSKNGYLGMKMTVEKVSYSNMGEKVIVFKTSVNHNLHIGRYINMYMQIGDKTFQPTERVQVVGVGTETGFDKEKYFSIRESDMPAVSITETKNGEEITHGIYLIEQPDKAYYCDNSKGAIGGANGNIVLFSYRNNVNNTPCDYYVRKFKKIKSKEIDETTKEPKDLTYDVSKIAFGTNIYGDDMAQLIFNEDVDLSGLRDNRGRELSEIYLTIIKTNRGHDLWYKRSVGNTSAIEKVKAELENKRDERVEYSHCFGKVTSGIEMNDDAEDYNVYKLHNLNTEKVPGSTMNIIEIHGNNTYDPLHYLYGKNGELKGNYSYVVGTNYIFEGMTPPKAIEDDITITGASDGDRDEFFGDIVEFNPNDYTETVLARIFYRFNTEQRECYYNEEYFNIFYDDLIHDDFDNVVIGKSTDDRRFKIKTSLQNITESMYGKGCSNSSSNKAEMTLLLSAGNLNPEGYYYSPHNRIVVKELSEDVSEASVDRLNIDTESKEDNFLVMDKSGVGAVSMVKLLSPRLKNYQKGENVMFYNTRTKETAFGTIDTAFDRQSILVKINESDADNVKEEDSEPIAIDSSLLPENTVLFEPDSANVYKLSKNVLVLYTNISVPSYAVFSPSSSSYIWRGPIKVSEVSSASTLYNAPFSNGAIYLEKNINLFLKRQDPHSINYLYNYDERPSKIDPERISTSLSTFLRREGMPKLDLRYLLEGDIDITLDLC